MRINPMVKKDIKVQARSMRICWEIFVYEAIMAVVFFFAMFFSFSRMILRLYAVPRKYCFIVHPNRSHMPALATSAPYKIATEPSSSPSAL